MSRAAAWVVLLAASCGRGDDAPPRRRTRAAPAAPDAAPVYQVTPLPSGKLAVQADPRVQVIEDFDREDYAAALAGAIQVLVQDPGEVRMMRVVVSCACILGQADLALGWAAKLSEHDREQMRRRCAKYGITIP